MKIKHSLFDTFFIKTRSAFSLDLRSLALFRILLSIVLIYDLLDRMVDLQDHYTDLGVLPRQALIESAVNFWEWSIYFSFGNPIGTFLLFSISIIVYCSLLIGYRTRLSTILAWILLTSLQTRNPMVLQGGDELLKMILFWSIFLPLGAYFSVDQPKQDSKNKFFSAASVGFIFQIIILYTLAGLYKLAERYWISGDALFLAFSSMDINTVISRAALNYPELIKWGSIITLIVEIGCPLLLLSPLKNSAIRYVLIFVFIFFHITVFLTFNVGIFITVPIAAWLALLPASFWKFKGASNLKMRLTHFFIILRDRLQVTWFVDLKHWRRFNFILVGVIPLVFLWNVAFLPGRPIDFPEALKPIIYGSSLQQAFGMFSVTVSRSGYLWMPGILENGTSVELTTRGKVLPERNDFPIVNRLNNPNDRWGKLTESIISNSLSMRLNVGKYLCRKLDEKVDASLSLDAFRIYYVHYKINQYKHEGPFFEVLWDHECKEGMLSKWQKKINCFDKDSACANEN